MSDPMPSITLHDGQPVTTSLDVAEHFGKQHRDVLRAIRKLDCSQEFNERNFALVDYIDTKGESRPMYRITRDGFAFLAMGFTGTEAAQWKEAYITAFNRMEAELRYRELVRLEQQDRLMALLQNKLERMETALFGDHPAWPVIAKAKEIGLTHAATCLQTGHKSPDTIRRNLRRMERYGLILNLLPVAGNA